MIPFLYIQTPTVFVESASFNIGLPAPAPGPNTPTVNRVDAVDIESNPTSASTPEADPGYGGTA